MQDKKTGKEKSDEEGHCQAVTDNEEEVRARQVMGCRDFSGVEPSSLL